MSIMKTLEFTSASKATDAVTIRRDRLVERLNYQIELAKDPHYAPVEKRWVKDKLTGERSLVSRQKRLRPWFFKTSNGELALFVKSGLKKIEFQPGKTAIKVGAKENLGPVLQSLIAATESGEMDKYLSPVKKKKN